MRDHKPVPTVYDRLDELGTALHRQGHTDAHIASILGCSRSMVCLWRRRRKLTVNPKRRPGSQLPPTEEEVESRAEAFNLEVVRFRDLWCRGMTDPQIAVEMGWTTKRVKERRTFMELERNSQARATATVRRGQHRNVETYSAGQSFPGANYTDEQREFLRAIDAWKRGHGHRMPTWREVLRVAKSLGYRRVDEVEGGQT